MHLTLEVVILVHLTLDVVILLTYLLSPWCRVLLEKLTGLQLVKKFPAFHGTRKFILLVDLTLEVLILVHLTLEVVILLTYLLTYFLHGAESFLRS